MIFWFYSVVRTKSISQVKGDKICIRTWLHRKHKLFEDEISDMLHFNDLDIEAMGYLEMI